MSDLKRHEPTSPDLPAILALIRQCFAFMDGLVSPPSTVHLLTEDSLRDTAAKAEVWSLGSPIIGCMILTPKDDMLYLGKLAVADHARGRGLARVLIDHAIDRAAKLGLAGVELGTRIELTGNQQAFEKMGFVEVERECHPGFDRHTAIVYRRPVGALEKRQK